MAAVLVKQKDIMINIERHIHDSLLVLHQMRTERKLCDVTLVVDSVEIPAHRSVLAACSPYFYFILTSPEFPKQERIELDLNAQAFLSVLNYMYTSKLVVPERNLKDVVEIARMLALTSLQSECCKLLAPILDSYNCLDIKAMAAACAELELQTSAQSYIDAHFEEVVLSDSFLKLPNDQVADLISKDSLMTSSEEKVFECVIRWINYDRKGRRRYLRFLMGHVRVSFISRSYIKQHIMDDPFLRGDTYCKDLIINALLEDNTTSSTKTKPRQYTKYVKMLLAVGGLESEAVRSLEYYDFAKKKWSEVLEMPFSISFAGLTAMTQTIYVTGGVNNLRNANPVKHYDITTNSWQEMIDTTTTRSGHGAVIFNNNIYAIGGYDGADGLSSAEKFDLKTHKWRPIKSMTAKRRDLGITVLNGNIYAVGGSDSNGSLKSVECYNHHTDSWNQVSNMNEHRSGVGVCTVDGKVYAVGGWNGTHCLNTVEAYNPDTDCWTEVGSMNVPRAWAGVTVVEDQICVTGGQSNPFTTLKSVELYNKLTDFWVTLPEAMNIERSRHSVVSVSRPI